AILRILCTTEKIAFWHYAILRESPHFAPGLVHPSTINVGQFSIYIFRECIFRIKSSKSSIRVNQLFFLCFKATTFCGLSFILCKEKGFKIMVTITKGVQTFDGKIPVTLLVDDVETANELIKLAKAANVPVVEQEDELNKSKNKTTQDKLKQIIKNKGVPNGTN
ncbi:TPA: hypothetical protein ACHG3R_005239, partial [Klebsiella pneumoniae]